MSERCAIIFPDTAMPTPWCESPPLKNIWPPLGKTKHSSTADLQVLRSWSQATSSVQKSWKRDSARMLCKFFVITRSEINSVCAADSEALNAWTRSFVASPVSVTSVPLFSNVLWHPYSKSCRKASMASRTWTFTMESSNHPTAKVTPTCATGINLELWRTTTLKLL